MKKKVLALVLAVMMAVGCFAGLGAGVDNAQSDTVTVTVNYVYDSNNSFVAQPYSAQLAKGDAFRMTVQAPKVLNYSVPVDKAEGLVPGQIDYAEDAAGNGAVTFNLASVDEDIVVNLYYVAGKTTYTVNHHYQNVDNDEYGEVQTVELTGDIDAYTEAVANSRPGFVCTGVPENPIAADGTTTVDIYYDRICYTVVFDVNGGINGPKPVYGKYGAPLTVSQLPTRVGYTFAGWDEALTPTIEGDKTYTAQWLPNEGNANYSIVFWGQNANDDEYSYLKSASAIGAPGDEVTWNSNTYICDGAHTHGANCYKLTCTIPEHTHTDACGLSCTHTHTAACYGATGSAASVANNPYYQYCGTYMKDGYVIYVDDNGSKGAGDKYYFFFGGQSYEIGKTVYDELKTGSQIASGSFKNASSIFASKDYYYVYAYSTTTTPGHCSHPSHTDACYDCGITAHTHSALGGSCYTLICTKQNHTHTSSCKTMGSLAPDSKLWEYVRSDTVTIDADGTTVLNVYFDRNEFTLNFRRAFSNTDNYGIITARWGASIHDRFNAISSKAGSNFWSENRNADGPYTNYVGIMPTRNIKYYLHESSGDKTVMTYYGEDLNGNYVQIFQVSFKGDGYTVTDEDRYQFEGYTYNHGTANGERCDDAEFYYDRNSYNLEFYSASKSVADKTNRVKYEQPLGSYDYTPANKPANMEADAVFVGWYLNPECTGQPYDLASHKMPASNVALYAKWVNGLYTVRTFTDEDMQTLYTYDGYNGVQEKIIKYTTAPVTPTAPTKDGYVFAGWFYKDADGSEQPFSFTMPITQNYDLYPKFTNKAVVSYTVHYYLAGTTTKLADDRVNSAMIGSSVTEKAKMGTELNLAEAGHTYFPDKTSTSVVLNKADMEIIFYYEMDVKVPYTVKYVDETGRELLPDKVVSDNTFSIVTETYVPILNYTPKDFRITKELSRTEENVIVFVYTANKYTLTYDPNGGTMTDASSVTYTVNDSIVIANAPTRNGYIFTGWKLDNAVGNWDAGIYNEKQAIDAGKYGDLTLVAQWQERAVTINYVVVGPDGCGTVTPASESIPVVTGSASGSTAAASSDNYRFIGWYSDARCTNLVSTDAKFVPTKSGEMWTAMTFYAKFDWNIADLTITKSGVAAADADQSFIFHITGNGTDMYVTIKGNGSATIKNLKVGTYKVEEVTSWSWRYTPADGVQSVSILNGQTNSVTFVNSRTNDNWLSAESSAVNKTGGRVS